MIQIIYISLLISYSFLSLSFSSSSSSSSSSLSLEDNNNNKDNNKEDNNNCIGYLKFHSLLGGIGIFSSKDYKIGDIITYETSLSLHTNFTRQSMIDYYATAIYEKPNDDILIFGISLLLNHHPEPNVRFIQSYIPLDDKNDLKKFTLIALKNISKGEELFNSYGTELWFEHRNLKMINPDNYNLNNLDMKTIPGCIRSSIIFSKGNLYTLEKIKKGEIIEVNRALVVPGHVSIGNDLEEYVWFREGYNALRGSLVILGHGALYNSPLSGNLEDANVIYSWYNPNSPPTISSSPSSSSSPPLTSTTTLTSTIVADNSDSLIEDLIESSSDITCSLSMLVMFTALRDIEANEILTIPLRRDSTPFTINKSGEELKRPRPRKYRQDVRRKLVVDKYLPGDCF